jgi:hypothetical protein
MRDYRALRNYYFGKTIPPVEDLMIRLMPRHEINRFMEDGDELTDGVCFAGKYDGHSFPYIIALADDLDVRQSRQVLLHEMAHMKVNLKFGRKMGEGKYWTREMRRLMRAGAFDGWL